MAGRGRGFQSKSDELRRPGSKSATESKSKVELVLDDLSQVKSKDDLRLQTVSADAKGAVATGKDLQALVDGVVKLGLNDKNNGDVVSSFCSSVQHLQADDTKFRSLLLTRLQEEYKKREDIAISNRKQLLSSAVLFGELYTCVRTDSGSLLNVLAKPVLSYLELIVESHLAKLDDSDSVANEEICLVVNQLLLCGSSIANLLPRDLSELLMNLSEVLCTKDLSSKTRVNLLLCFSELWPLVSLQPRVAFAALAKKMDTKLLVL